jgi:hypothetical protein
MNAKVCEEDDGEIKEMAENIEVLAVRTLARRNDLKTKRGRKKQKVMIETQVRIASVDPGEVSRTLLDRRKQK